MTPIQPRPIKMTEGEAAVDGRKHGSIEVPAKKWKKRDMEKMAPRTEEQLKSKLDKAGGMTLELVAKDGNGKTIKAMPLEMKHFGTGSVGYTISESLHLTLKTGEDEEGQPLSLFCTSNCELPSSLISI